ncbi:MAG: hypothetical protein RIT45_3784 [Pseudomonadota bacterium]
MREATEEAEMAALDEDRMVDDIGLDDEQQMLLMAYADGELDDDAELRARVEGWIAEKPALGAAVSGQRALRSVLREAVFEERQLSARIEEELSMTRGRVLTKLPAEAREPVAETVEPAAWSGILGWLASVGWGRVAFGAGAVAAAVLLVVALRSPHQANGVIAGPAIAEQGDANDSDEPEVIIEEMEIDSGTIVVDPSRRDVDGPVIIWHLDGESDEEEAPMAAPQQEGEG